MLIRVIESIQIGTDYKFFILRSLDQDNISWNNPTDFGVEVHYVAHDDVFGIDQVLFTVS